MPAVVISFIFRMDLLAINRRNFAFLVRTGEINVEWLLLLTEKRVRVQRLEGAV